MFSNLPALHDVTDSDAARLVLRWFYDHRDDAQSRTLSVADLEEELTLTQLHRALDRLYDSGQIDVGYKRGSTSVPIIAYGIRPAGVDAIEHPPPPVTDREKRNELLGWFYANRHDLRGKQMVPIPYTDAIFLRSGKWGEAEIYRIGRQLLQDGLISAGFDAGSKKVYPHEITPEGVRYIEDGPPAPATTQTFNLHGPVTASQFGNGNTMNVSIHLQALVEAVKASDMADDEKQGALQRLKEFVVSPGVANGLQLGSLTAQLFGGS